jgi:hypothetical protein
MQCGALLPPVVVWGGQKCWISILYLCVGKLCWLAEYRVVVVSICSSRPFVIILLQNICSRV